MQAFSRDQQELWTKLEALALDDPRGDFTFSDRLARENGWSKGFALEVVEEYRKFLFLAAMAGHPVTPSDEVDQAWHLHLTYSRSYWEELCGEILGFPLHHGPTRGGDSEKHKFADWYRRTLTSYERFFGTPPPADCWPPPPVRFGLAPHFVRVNTQTHWVVPKAQLPSWRAVALLLAVIPLLVSCARFLESDPGKVPSWVLVLVFVATVTFLVGMVLWAGRLERGQKKKKRLGSHTGCGGCKGQGSASKGDSGDPSGCGGDAGCGGCGGCGA